MNKKIKILLQILVIVTILFFMGKQIANSWQYLKDYDWNFNYFYLVISFLLSLFYFALIAFGWFLILKKMNIKINFVKAANIRAATQFGRYIPGKVWHIVGRTYYTNKLNIPSIKILTSVGLEIACSLIAAFIVFLFTLPFFLKHTNFEIFLFLFVVISIILVLIKPSIFSKFINTGLRILGKSEIEFNLKYKDIFLIILWFTFSWFLNGVAFFMLINSIYRVDLSILLLISGVYAISWVIGFLSFLTPAGIGVREGILSGMLSFYVPPSIAIIISFIARVMIMLVEITFFIMFTFIDKKKR
ncbi:hypothetical protein GF327_09015 [Candidatus Woesearchaeota archaeon]|nr:hypothetical protein [Candidatus Woesearchaeota archaeon]